MPTTVPPYPVLDSPETDLMMRELYSRTTALEQVTGITETIDDIGTEELGNVNLVGIVPTKLIAKSVAHTSGWGTPNAPLFIGRLAPPAVIHAVYATVRDPFSQGMPIMRLAVTIASNSPDQYDTHVASSIMGTNDPPFGVQNGGINLQYNAPGADNPYSFWQNVGRLFTNADAGGGYINLYAGFNLLGPSFTPGLYGVVYVTVLYTGAGGEVQQVPLVEIGSHTLLEPKPLI